MLIEKRATLVKIARKFPVEKAYIHNSNNKRRKNLYTINLLPPLPWERREERQDSPTRNSLKCWEREAQEKFIASCGIFIPTKALLIFPSISTIPSKCISLFSIRKIVVSKNIVLAPIIESFHPKNFHYSMCYNFLLLRINRPIKSDRMNLLFYGNVNTLFIKFSAFFLFLRFLKSKTFAVTYNIKNYENDIKLI